MTNGKPARLGSRSPGWTDGRIPAWFPDCCYAWRRHLQYLRTGVPGDSTDERGYNLSDKPEGLSPIPGWLAVTLWA